MTLMQSNILRICLTLPVVFSLAELKEAVRASRYHYTDRQIDSTIRQSVSRGYLKRLERATYRVVGQV
jgi:hypothetical protein